jgi:pyruvate,water dikinase
MEPRTAEIIQTLLTDPRIAPIRASSRRVVARRLLGVLRRTRIPSRAAYAFLMPARARRSATAPARALLAAGDRAAGTPLEALDHAQWLAHQVPQRVMVPIAPAALLVGAGSLFAATALARAVGAEEDVALITGGLPHNVTTEMNLSLWALSRRARQDPPSAMALETMPPQELALRYRAGELSTLLQHEVTRFLQQYGFRGVAEFDLGVPRWEDDPAHVFGSLSNYLRVPDGDMAPDTQFRWAAAEAEAAMARVLARARTSGPLGPLRAVLLRLLFHRVRELLGTREAPKFYLIAIAGRCRKLLRQTGTALTDAGQLEEPDDIFFLTFAEARAALAGEDYRALVRERHSAYQREMKRRRIPRVLLSDGTALYGESTMHSIAGDTVTGTPASPGVYSGVARVVMEPSGARLEPGEILVAPSTDPGWTPLFMTAGALVMEMGGMMSHGSVVAREYGIPAVVGAIGATTAIRSGQWITVDGARGVVTIAEKEAPQLAETIASPE